MHGWLTGTDSGGACCAVCSFPFVNVNEQAGIPSTGHCYWDKVECCGIYNTWELISIDFILYPLCERRCEIRE
jgi:hypothetical protein